MDIGSDESVATGDEESGIAVAVEINAKNMQDFKERISGMIAMGGRCSMSSRKQQSISKK